jgi:hypothetical protein
VQARDLFVDIDGRVHGYLRAGRFGGGVVTPMISTSHLT